MAESRKKTKKPKNFLEVVGEEDKPKQQTKSKGIDPINIIRQSIVCNSQPKGNIMGLRYQKALLAGTGGYCIDIQSDHTGQKYQAVCNPGDINIPGKYNIYEVN
jgi:hypothetical protein